MNAITVIFPNQLFEAHPALDKKRQVWLIEDSLFFGDPHAPLRFHKHKLMLHRASMKAYAAKLTAEGYDVTYVDHQPGKTLVDVIPGTVRHLWLADPVDYLLERRLHRWQRRHQAELHILETPMFLTPKDWFTSWCDGRKRYFMADFYMAQRKRMGILVDAHGKPEGGQWSFDAENRKRWPAGQQPPPVYTPPRVKERDEAEQYVQRHFPNHPGDTKSFWYPVTRAQARASFQHFLAHRFRGFGDFEDAISQSHLVLHHAVLTPALNIGLITPAYVVEQTLAYAKKHNVPLNDLEGFLRQIIGWREFMRIVYVREGVKQRQANFWKHTRRLTPAWYDGTNGLDPLDQVIRRVTQHSYCHHIERLMVVGNAMLLCELHPDDIYTWFMELFIDAYDWVMVPNVYGMSQFTDGGLITTKPYFSGSNYLKKMSDAKTGPWCDVWDGLYWRFIEEHRNFFAANPRLSMMVKTLDNMDPERKEKLRRTADLFLSSLN